MKSKIRVVKRTTVTLLPCGLW